MDIRPTDRIKHQIGMGSGIASMALCYHLHRKLEEAFSILNGIQQAPRSIDKKDIWKQYEIDYDESVADLDHIAKEICMALTGKKIKFIEPPKKEN